MKTMQRLHLTSPMSPLSRQRISVIALLCLLLASVLASTRAVADDWRYSMRPGDTIWAICQEYTVYPNCWQELGPYNGVSQATRMSTGYVLKIPGAWLKQAQVAARVIYVQGAASLTMPDQQPQALSVGQDLRIGQGISVNEGSVTLEFADGATIVMDANSELVIDSVSALKQSRSQAVDVSLPRGDIKVTVPRRDSKPRFRVKTPAAVAAVRGTSFRVSSEVPAADGEVAQMRSEVLEGVVEVAANDQSSEIGAGFGIRAEQGQPLSEPSRLLSAPTWNLECTDPGYVEWQGSPETVAYQLVLMEDDTTVDRIISKVSVTASNYTFTDLEERCYQVKVSSVDKQGFNGLESQRQLCYELILAQPFFNETRLGRGAFKADWNTVAFADSYLVEISDSEDFSRMLHSEVVDSTQLALNQSDLPSSVYVRAKAQSESGAQSEYSDPVYVERQSSRNILIGILATALAFIAL